MGITDRTRKTLWARSGNRCLLCRIELVQETESEKENLIIGEECHIVSKKKGPRNDPNFSGNHDHFNNLILLCPTDHKRIDELIDIYTTERLLLSKLVHENWVKTTLERDVIAFTNDQLNIKSLPKITSGKQLVDMVHNAHMFNFEHSELETEIEAEKIGEFFDYLQEWGDMLEDVSSAEIAKLGVKLSENIAEIQSMGFLLFGLRRGIKTVNDKNQDMSILDSATLIAVKHDDPSIVGDFLITKFPESIKFKF